LHQRPIKVLLIEPDEDHLAETRETLAQVRPPAIEVEWAGRLSDALARLTEGGIEAVLLNLELPDSQGVATFERTYAFAPDVPIVVLTDEADDAAAVSTVQGGAQDYLVRDEIQPALLARSIRHAIERHRLLSALRSLSLIDDLTGLYNRRGFADLGAQYLKLARRTSRSVTLVYLDLDRFKTINDTLGHHVGDRALINVAEILRTTFRRSDIVARMGGDEFAVLALEGSDEKAENLGERVQERVAEFNRTHRGPYRISVSLGTARQDGDQRTRVEDLLAEADEVMHEAKKAKRAVLQEQA
jgi:diguanylate cyclase (GGDEF)-like protein